MSTRRVAIPLTPADLGLDLEIQFVDDNGADVGVPITAVIVELGGGAYGWRGDFPATPGYGLVRPLGGGNPLAIFANNPEDLETAEDIDATLSASHGAGSWEPHTGGGSNTVNFTVESTSGPVIGGLVTIKEDGDLRAWGRTDLSGELGFALEVGNYTYSVQAESGYVSVIDEPLEVSTDPQAVLVTMEEQTSTPPSEVGLCRVIFTCTINGRPQQGCRVNARLVNINSAAANNLLAAQKDEAESDVDGEAVLELVQGAQFTKGDGLYEITVLSPLPDQVVNQRVRSIIPEEEEIYFSELL
jgi:hypothetical protein